MLTGCVPKVASRRELACCARRHGVDRALRPPPYARTRRDSETRPH